MLDSSDKHSLYVWLNLGDLRVITSQCCMEGGRRGLPLSAFDFKR